MLLVYYFKYFIFLIIFDFTNMNDYKIHEHRPSKEAVDLTKMGDP